MYELYPALANEKIINFLKEVDKSTSYAMYCSLNKNFVIFIL